MSELRQALLNDIERAINANSAENGCDTPDFILAHYLLTCLNNFDDAVNAREKWYGRTPRHSLNLAAPSQSP